jgi:hypothetical protein
MEYSLKSSISGSIRIAGFENQNRLKDTPSPIVDNKSGKKNTKKYRELHLNA